MFIFVASSRASNESWNVAVEKLLSDSLLKFNKLNFSNILKVLTLRKKFQVCRVRNLKLYGLKSERLIPIIFFCFEYEVKGFKFR